EESADDVTNPENLLGIGAPVIAGFVEIRDGITKADCAWGRAVAKALALGVVEQDLFYSWRGGKVGLSNKQGQNIRFKLSPFAGKADTYFILSRKLHSFHPSPQ